MNRRAFVRGMAAGAAVSIVPARVLGRDGAPPSAKLNIAGIGVGRQGLGDLKKLADENIVALCDVDPGFAAKARTEFSKASFHTDWRAMLEKEKGIDAVLIATPDHTHAVIAAAAMRAGKHVFCEKPLTHDIREARTLARIAKETGVVTQMGIQGHSGDGIRRLREWIEGGVLGEIREVDAWCSLTYYPPGRAYWSPVVLRRPTETPEPPADLNWDVWIGPAPMRPYHKAYHPGAWRAWWDFGNGMMGDRGVHTLDSAVWGLGLGKPESVEASCTDLNDDTHPIGAVVTFRFAARGAMPPVKLTWYEGLRAPLPPELEDGRTMGHPEGGLLFKGSKAFAMAGVYAESPRIIPEARMQELVPSLPPKSRPTIEGGHYANWARACKGQDKAVADFEYSAHLTEICQLGNIAKRMQKRIVWDAEKMAVTNLPEANRFVAPEYRAGWSL